MTLVRWIALVAVAMSFLVLSPTSRAQTFAPAGNLDCNGYSKIQAPLRAVQRCTDFTGAWAGRGYDNGHYIGHDEPSVGFISTAHRSGNNMQWDFTLTRDKPLPAPQSFELFPAVWFSMALCDPNSYPGGACIPDSDLNVPTVAGSAALELQFYPPGWPPFITQVSCDMTHWCAALTIDSVETIGNNLGQVNPNCTEPYNFAFIQRDGVPTGPPGPATATLASYYPNGQTLLMNPGDHLRLTIKDTREGLLTRVEDLTTGESGFMVASGNNGFQNTDPTTCAGANFDFHPEFDTAKDGNYIPWTVLQANINFSMELGHFEAPDGDADDAPCFPGPNIAGCEGADVDFDGTSYQFDWPGAAVDAPTSIRIGSVTGNGLGPMSPSGDDDFGNYDRPYPIIHIESTISDSESTCQSTGIGCVIPPVGAELYPFYSLVMNGAYSEGDGQSCTLLFGDITGPGVETFGRDKQYGPPNLPWFFGQNTSGPRANPCLGDSSGQ